MAMPRNAPPRNQNVRRLVATATTFYSLCWILVLWPSGALGWPHERNATRTLYASYAKKNEEEKNQSATATRRSTSGGLPVGATSAHEKNDRA